MQPAEVVDNELLRQLIEQVPAAIAMYDRDMRYIAASRRWIDAYLPGVSDPIGQCHYDLFPDCPERWRIDHRRGLAGENVRVEEAAICRRAPPAAYQQANDIAPLLPTPIMRFAHAPQHQKRPTP